MGFTKGELEKINVYTLRNLARDIGVKSPTSLTKPLLIEKILQIQSGKSQPHEPSKRGRPVINNMENNHAEGLLSIKEKAAIKKELIDKILKEIEAELYEIF
jgi:hypothetical protein